MTLHHQHLHRDHRHLQTPNHQLHRHLRRSDHRFFHNLHVHLPKRLHETLDGRYECSNALHDLRTPT